MSADNHMAITWRNVEDAGLGLQAIAGFND
jgi:hypothetical protein